jgi:hypothetical protein
MAVLTSPNGGISQEGVRGAVSTLSTAMITGPLTDPVGDRPAYRRASKLIRCLINLLSSMHWMPTDEIKDCLLDHLRSHEKTLLP